MRESLGIVGELRVIRLSDDRLLFGDDLNRALDAGQAQIELEQKNIIVDIGLSMISRIIGGNAGLPQVYHPTTPFGFSSITDIAVAKMELGNAAVPPVPAAGDTTGVGALLFTPNLTVTYPDNFSVQFSGLVPKADFDGETFTEEALLLRNGQLFAKTRFSKAKTASFALQFDHKFTFSRI